MKYSSFGAVERVGGRTPGQVLSPTVRVEEGTPRARQAPRRVSQAATRRSARARLTRSDFCYYLDTQGRQHFNFAQQIWLRPRVAMAVTPVMTIALETLAINLLTHLTRERDCPVAVGVTSRRVLKLARLFCKDCLLTARAEGWVMPRASLREWLSSQARGRRRVRR